MYSGDHVMYPNPADAVHVWDDGIMQPSGLPLALYVGYLEWEGDTVLGHTVDRCIIHSTNYY